MVLVLQLSAQGGNGKRRDDDPDGKIYLPTESVRLDEYAWQSAGVARSLYVYYPYSDKSRTSAEVRQVVARGSIARNMPRQPSAMYIFPGKK